MSRLFERLVEKRGFGAEFLDPKYDEVGRGGELPGVEEAVARIKLAVERGEKVLIYGDYDADGVTASVVMYDALTLAGVKEVEIMLPNRFTDGYGMSKKCVQFAKEQGVGLVVTVDCGSNNAEVVRELGEAGVDTVVTDHHEVLGEIPDAVAIVNPHLKASNLAFFRTCSTMSRVASGENTDLGAFRHGLNPKLSKKVVQKNRGERGESGEIEQKSYTVARKGSEVKGRKNDGEIEQKICSEGVECPAGMRNLAGVGVAFMVARGLVKAGMIPAGQEKWLLDLVVIGTVCDSMKMRGENRRLCYWGMKVLEKTRRVGLQELMKVAGVKEVNTEAIGFMIGPRINAAGRMESAELALKLLMTKSKVEAARLAAELEELNKARRRAQQAAVQEVEMAGVGEEPVIVVGGEWHEGVLGIIAGKLVEEYEKPAFAFQTGGGEIEQKNCSKEVGKSEQKICSTGVMKGSGRSFGDFNLAEALVACEDYIIGGGGHAGACGVKVVEGGLEEFRRAVNRYYRGLKLTEQEQYLREREDLTVRRLGSLTLELMEELGQLEPYGEGNAEPVFLLNEVKVVEAARLGKNLEHLRLTVRGEDGVMMKLMGFFAPEEWLGVRSGGVVDVWMRLVANEFRGVRTAEGRILRLEGGRSEVF